MLAAFAVTVLAGLSMKFGVHRFVAALLLNAWFLVEIALPGTYHLSHIHTSGWGQGLAWLIGAALTIAYTCIVWLARGRTAQPEPIAEIPGGTAPVTLTRPVILFAVIRAVAIAITVAIAFGLHLPNADWMPIACLVAMKPSLAQSTLVAMQRLAGAIIGAAVAALFLLTLHSKTGLEVVIVVLGALAGSIRLVNYAFYCAAVAGAALIAADLPHPSNLADEGQRVLCTFIGVGIGVLIMLLAGLLQKHGDAQSGAAGTCSRGPVGVSGPGTRRPGARHTAPAPACTTVTSAGVAVRPANGRSAGEHSGDVSRASWLALTPVHAAGAT